MSPLIAEAIAQPTACGYCVPRLPEIVKKPGLARRVHHRQLTAVQAVALVGVDLAHHVDERPVAGNQPALLPVGREEHVAVAQLERLADGDRLLTGAARCRTTSCPGAGRAASVRRTARVVTIASSACAQRVEVDVAAPMARRPCRRRRGRGSASGRGHGSSPVRRRCPGAQPRRRLGRRGTRSRRRRLAVPTAPAR